MLRIINFFPSPLITWAITCEYNEAQEVNNFQFLITHDYERFVIRLTLRRNKTLLEDRNGVYFAVFDDISTVNVIRRLAVR
jgi:hypothetical protein